MVIYDGPSCLDGQPIIAVVTGLHPNYSVNEKTGRMAQVWILVKEVNPLKALDTGADKSICGDCVLRKNGCYVLVGKAPRQVWHNPNNRVPVAPSVVGSMLAKHHQGIRLGAYGDPAAVPLSVWAELLLRAPFWTGYTHQWRQPRFQEFRHYVMASVETVTQLKEAEALGWRAFIALRESEKIPGVMECPADTARRGTNKMIMTCAQCKACNGTTGKKGRHVSVLAHGGAVQKRMMLKTLEVLHG